MKTAWWRQHWSELVVGAAVLANVVMLAGNVLSATPPINDDVLHLTVAEDSARALGHSLAFALDPWIPEFMMGYPVLHAYPPLPTFVLVFLHWVLAGSVSVATLYRWTKLLLLAGFPVPVFIGFRKLGLTPRAAALAGVSASLLSAPNLYGLDWSSYTASGYGLYAQLWGAFFLPLALGYTRELMLTGKGYGKAGAAIAATFLSHLEYGYILLASLPVIYLFSAREQWRSRAGRLLVVVGLSVVIGAFFLVPAWADRIFLNDSFWTPRYKYDSFGHQVILTWLLRGDLLDSMRLPVLTVMLGVGVVAACWKQRLTLTLFVMWLLLYFGRPSWDGLLDFLPLGKELEFHRLIGAVQLFGVGLSGVGFDTVMSAVERWLKKPGFIVSTALAVALLAPAYYQKYTFAANEAAGIRAQDAKFAEVNVALAALWQELRALEQQKPGRVYAGGSWNWGERFKIGFASMFALMPREHFETIGYMYHSMSIDGDSIPFFDSPTIRWIAQPPPQSDYQRLGIRYVIAPVGMQFPAFVLPRGQFGPFALYEVATDGDVTLADSPFALRGARAQLFTAWRSWRLSPLFSRNQVPAVFFDEGRDTPSRDFDTIRSFSEPMPQSPAPPPTGTLKVRKRVPGEEYLVDVSLERPRVVRFLMTYHPNWHAEVDGQPARMLMLMPSDIGVPVGPGTHTVRLYYSPPPMRVPLFLIGIVALLGAFGYDWRHRTIPAPAPPPEAPAATTKLGPKRRAKRGKRPKA